MQPLSKKEEGYFDKLIRYTRTLLRGGGVPALYGGLGFLLVAGGAAYLASSWNTTPAFGVIEGAGVLMIVLAHRQRIAEIQAGALAFGMKVEAKIVPEDEAVSLLGKGWEYVDALPSGRLVVIKRTPKP